MLAPNIFDTNELLTNLYNEIISVSSYSYGVQNTMIGKIPLEPNWIPAVRSEMQIMSVAGANWIQNYPQYWSKILLAFSNYSTIFSAATQEINPNPGSLTNQQYIALLSSLSQTLSTCASDTQNALNSLADFENGFTSVFPSLNKSINEGWKDLQSEEQEMIAIAQALTQLQNDISNLQSQISSNTISSGKSFVQTNVKIAYDILSEVGEVAIPYLSIASLAYTIGQTFYEIIANTEKINDDLKEIADLQLKATDIAQAAAATKATLQYLYQIEIQFLTIQKHGNGLYTMWMDQKGKIDEAIDAINAGADPRHFLAIMTMPIASTNWNNIQNFVQQILSLYPQFGPDVNLSTNPKK